jgi:hypothetical protein
MSKHKPFPWRIGAMQNGKVAIDSADGQAVTDWIDPEDAQVILSAQDLLEALENIVNSLVDSDEEGLIEHTEQIENARAAIAKARGES